MQIKQWLNWRYATKQFDAEKKVPEADLNYILEAGNLAATSYGLQPFGLIVVTDEAKKQALQAHAFNQVQVGTNSALIVVAARTDVNEAMIEDYINRIASTRGIEAGSLDSYKGMMVGHLTSLSEADRLTWAQRQSYLALGTMMAAAAEKGVDSCPMEGFDPVKFNDILGLSEHHLHATALLPIGYRAADDAYQNYAKVRREMSDLVKWL